MRVSSLFWTSVAVWVAHTPTTSADTILQLTQDTEALSTLETAVGIVDGALNAGVGTLLDDAGQTLTVFAPTDDAFADLDSDFFNFLVNNPEQLLKVLLYHVVPNEAIETGDFGFLNPTETLYLDGEEVLLSRSWTWSWRNGFRRKYFVNAAQVETKDVSADNGVVHLIDKVLIPPDLLEVATLQEGLVTLTAALVLAELADDLQAESTNVFTLFAPSNQAFLDLDEDVRNYLFRQDGNEALQEILKYHLIEGEVAALDILNAGDQATFTTVQGEDLTFGTQPGVFINGDTEVTETDIPALNGIIHIIDKVLIPDGVQMDVPSMDIVEIVVDRDDLGTLEVAVTTAPGLADDLKEDGPFTLFAPDDNAFSQVTNLQDILNDPSGELTDLLNHHVLQGFYSADLLLELDGVSLRTLNGDYVEITVDGQDNIFVDGVQVTEGDIDGTNGVVHVIGSVLELPEDVEEDCPYSGIVCWFLGFFSSS